MRFLRKRRKRRKKKKKKKSMGSLTWRHLIIEMRVVLGGERASKP